MNNMTVDGSYFNNSFGLGGTARRPHRRRADLARGDRAGAGQRRAVRRAPGQLHRRRREHRHAQRHQPASPASFYHRCAQPGLGRHRGRPARPSTRARSRTATPAAWAGGPIIKNKLFAFGNYEKQEDTRPLTTFTSNPGGEPVGGQHDPRARVGSDRAQLVSVSTNFKYDTGPFDNIDEADAGQARSCSRATTTSTTRNKVSFRYNQLDSSTDVGLSSSTSRSARPADSTATNFLSFAELELPDSREHQVGHRRVELGVRQHDVQRCSIGYTKQDESRGARGRRCSRSSTSSTARQRRTRRSAPSRSRRTTSCATTRSSCRTTSRSSAKNHSLTFGGTSRSTTRTTSFFTAASQSAYVYNSLADFYADANGFLANPNRTVSPVHAAPLPGAVHATSRARTKPPIQPLDVVVQRRLRPGRVAAAVEPDGHRRPALRRAEVRATPRSTTRTPTR